MICPFVGYNVTRHLETNIVDPPSWHLHLKIHHPDGKSRNDNMIIEYRKQLGLASIFSLSTSTNGMSCENAINCNILMTKFYVCNCKMVLGLGFRVGLHNPD